MRRDRGGVYYTFAGFSAEADVMQNVCWWFIGNFQRCINGEWIS